MSHVRPVCEASIRQTDVSETLDAHIGAELRQLLLENLVLGHLKIKAFAFNLLTSVNNLLTIC